MGHRWVQVHGVSSTRYDSRQMELLRQAGRHQAVGGSCGSSSMRMLPRDMQRGLQERVPRCSSNGTGDSNASSASVSVNSLYNAVSSDEMMGMTHNGGAMEQQEAASRSSASQHPSLATHFARRMNLSQPQNADNQARGTWHHANPAGPYQGHPEMYYPMGATPQQHNSGPMRPRVQQMDHMQGQAPAPRPDLQEYPSLLNNSVAHPSMEALIRARSGNNIYHQKQ